MQVRKLDWCVWMCSFISTMFLGVEIGLAISIGLALMIVIYESAFPHTALLGRVGRTTIYRNVKQFPDSQVLPSGVNHGIDRHVRKAGQLLQVHISCPSDDVGVLWTATPYAFDFAHVQGISDTLIHKISVVALQVIPGIAACRVDAAMYFASELLSGCVAPFSYAP
jgi:MFS superfamily sulfate permease-like transporter